MPPGVQLENFKSQYNRTRRKLVNGLGLLRSTPTFPKL